MADLVFASSGSQETRRDPTSWLRREQMSEFLFRPRMHTNPHECLWSHSTEAIRAHSREFVGKETLRTVPRLIGPNANALGYTTRSMPISVDWW